MLVVI
ncbi:hypothetical protein CP8484711_0622A, partial [Chlamydia psittaci 84-8471/1]